MTKHKNNTRKSKATHSKKNNSRKSSNTKGRIKLKYIALSGLILSVMVSFIVIARRTNLLSADAQTANRSVVVLGDSIVYGYATPVRRWTDIVQSNLKNKNKFKDVKIINQSVPGQSIISTRAKQTDKNKLTIGGELYNHVLSLYPKSTPKSKLPTTVLIVPSINEIVVSTQSTSEKKVEYAISGLKMIRQYLISLGIRNVYITSMLQSSIAWDDTTPQDVNKTIVAFNNQLKANKMLSTSSYNLDLDNILGSDNTYFINTDNLHPNQKGHNHLANQMTKFLTGVKL